MKRQQIQNKISRAANSISKGITTGNFKQAVRGGHLAVVDGKPQTALGFVLTQAGLVGKRATVVNGPNGLAQVLGTDYATLPENVRNALVEIQEFEQGRSPSAVRRGLASRLSTFASALSSAKIRKAYEKSGKFTQAAREAGTFGTSAPLDAFETNATLSTATL